MERKKYIFIIIISLIFLPLIGQSNKQIYDAYIKGDMEKWKNSMDVLSGLSGKSKEDELNIINYQYGYIAWCIDNEKMDEAESYIKISEAIINNLEQQGYNLSMLYAYKAAFIGFKIGIAPYKAPFIGPESSQYAKKSVAIDSTNAFGYIQLGNIAYYTPSMFGGSKKEAMNYYKKALALMEKDRVELSNNWNYLNLLATIITAYIDVEQYSMAEQFCIKSLIVEPRFNWVENKLYPQVLNHLEYD